MTDPKDIRLVPKGDLIIARIKVGKDWVDRSGGWRSKAEAREPAIALRDKLQAEYAREHPETVAEAAQDGATAPAPARREKSLREDAEEKAAEYIKRQRLRAGDNHFSGLNWIWKQMGAKADIPSKQQKPATATALRNRFIDGDLSQRTMEQYSKTSREIFRQIKNLHPSFVTELENLPKKDGATEASGEPFQRSHFKVMFSLINAVCEVVQILFWIGASGGPQIVDTVFLPFWAIDWTSGMIKYWRVKTGEKIEFCALPPLMDLLRKRRDQLGPDAIYVLPELVFTRRELKNPECNTEKGDLVKSWKGKTIPKKYADRGANRGTNEMTSFLRKCGIKTKDLTHKSFRKHAISFWASIGIKLKTRMRMAGHSKESAHYRYDVPAEFEIVRAKDITWRYYQSIMKGEEFFIPTTPYDIYEALMGHWSKFPELLRATMQEQLKGSFDVLFGYLRDAFGAQKSLIEQQTRILQAENAQLREQLRSHEQHLIAIRASCEEIKRRLPGGQD